MHRIINGDVLRFCEHYHGPACHALICDPPYHLSGGFMSQTWDKDGPDAIAFQPETWAALGEHLLPGAFGMAFASSRGWHRLAVAIEDAGFRIHPSIFGWVQGQGFSKSTNIHKQLEQTFCYKDDNGDWFYTDNDEPMQTKPPFRHPQAEVFFGHRYGLQAMAPKIEPIIVFQKPYEGRPVDSITATGAGALNIDAARINTTPSDNKAVLQKYQSFQGASKDNWKLGWRRPWMDEQGAGEKIKKQQDTAIENLVTKGRWPPNFFVSHLPPHAYCPTCAVPYALDSARYCPDCGAELERHEGCRKVGERKVQGITGGGGVKTSDKNTVNCYGKFNDRILPNRIGYADPDGKEAVAEYNCPPWCAVHRLGEQSGEREVSGTAKSGKINKVGRAMFCSCESGYQSTMPNDKGTAARFYLNPDWSHEIAERLDGADPAFYTAKASRRERDAGLSGEKRFLATMGDGIGEREHNPEQPSAWVRNHHPTVKPISLGTWLASLLLPPDAYAPRRLLLPFCGSGSEMIGALLAGWETIIGIEQDATYCDIARARLAWWSEQARWGCNDPKVILNDAKSEDDSQLELW